jgi:CHAD domain-containing protein
MEPMHRWRKWVKLLLFQSGWLLDETAPKWISQVKALGSALGRLHDLDVLAVQMEEARACFWQEDLDQVSTGIKAARLNALGEIDVLTDEIYAKRARKRAKQLYRRWKH